MKIGTAELRSGALRLRRYTAEDAAVLYENIGCDAAMSRYTGWNPYAAPESAAGFVAGIIEGYEKGAADYSWMIEADGRAVGMIGAYDYDDTENAIEIGCSVFRAYWGRGYGAQALALVCGHLTGTEGIARLTAWIAAENIGSRRILEKAGFTQTEIREDAVDAGGTRYDQIFYVKTAESRENG